jgi:hypothetical protein
MTFRSLLSLLAVLVLVAAGPKTDWKDVEAALGRAGTVQPDGVYKVSFPRGDLSVIADSVAVKPALALGSWAAFNESGGHAMVMGDLVLLESEVNPVIDQLQKGGIEQTAVHNHLIGESPPVMYMHFSGHGHATALARTLHDALATTKTPIGPPAAPAAAPLDLPTADLDRIIGHAGFLDPQAEIIFVESSEVAALQERENAVGFDAPGARDPHQDERGRCSFEQLVDITPESAGLWAISQGFGDDVAKDDAEIVQRASFIDDSLLVHLRRISRA